MNLPDYQPLASNLDGAFSPAEAHGLLCGLLCGNPVLTAEDWLSAAARETDRASTLTAELGLLYESTVIQLDGPDFDLQLLLPDDEQPLDRRADALGYWCQGFLAGLGLGGVTDHDGLSDDVREFLSDAAEIARISFDAHEPDSDDEFAFTELVEYVRIGALLVRESLHGERRLH
ncbi:MAG: UPF0149 family protein [Candidatus Competibacterales bacterium]|nr:UPF0149 family protein [Candidatus Competibacterales bacterium]